MGAGEGRSKGDENGPLTMLGKKTPFSLVRWDDHGKAPRGMEFVDVSRVVSCARRVHGGRGEESIRGTDGKKRRHRLRADKMA